MNPLADKAKDHEELEALDRALADTPASELTIIDASFLTVEAREDQPEHYLRRGKHK